ncbi:MAG: TolC family protein [Lautropia sp.]|nr:TolC family protein [Lautropia sp.]
MPDETRLSFEEAWARLTQVSDAIAAAHAQVGSKRQLAEAARSLRLPDMSLDVREIKYQKTGEFALGPLAPAFAPLGVPPVIPIDQGGWRLRPTVSVQVPLYTGGKIPAAQEAAAAAVRQADAERLAEHQNQAVQLVQLYFGQQLAAQALKVRTEVLQGLERHVADAIKLEQGGLATKAQRLQAMVAHDQASRDRQKADSDLATLKQTLSRVLRQTAGVRPSSPLFVISQPLEPLADFRDNALQHHPSLLKLRAVVEQAGQGVKVQEASLKPQLFLFGQRDLRRKDALMTDPDWVVGVGLKYTFLSGTDRPRQIGAAREQLTQAEAGLREAENQVSIGVTKAWNELETARQQFLLLDSSIRQAEENLRLQALSFREGQSTSLDVIDARTRLGAAFIERAQAAYHYDVALAHLLDVSGRMHRYADYMKRADKVIMP